MKFDKLGEIITIHKGKKHDISNNQITGLTRVLQIDDLRNDNTIKYTTDKNGIIAQEEDLLIVWDGANAGTIGYGKIGFAGSTIAVLRKRFPEKYNTDFLGKFLQSQFHYLRKSTTGATIPHIDRKSLENLKLPDINVETQIQIAAKLSKVESLISQRKESIRLLDELLKSTFLEMFGDPVRNSKSWKIDKINAFSNCIVPGRNKPKSFTGNIPWITTEDLKHKGFIKNSRDNLGLNVTEIIKVRAKIVPPGSVLMTCVGDLGIVSINTVDCVVNQQLHTFQPKEELNSIFLMYVLDFQTKSMYKMSNSTTVPYLNKSKCNSIPIILPPLYIQTRFAKIVKETEIIKKQYGRSLIELENLYSSLSQKAFKGEIGKM